MPSPAPDGMLDELTSRSQVVDVRDTPSRELFSSQTVTESGDDTFLDVGEHVYDQRDSRSVMICAQSDLRCQRRSVAETIIGTLRKWDVDGSRVGYVESHARW